MPTNVVADTDTTHISDFRQQPRSDSRADKPDTFPGFDAAGESKSPVVASPSGTAPFFSASALRAAIQQQSVASGRPPPRAELYAQLVAKLIGQIGLDTIVNGVERKQGKLQRLRRLKQLKARLLAAAVHPKTAGCGKKRRYVDECYLYQQFHTNY